MVPKIMALWNMIDMVGRSSGVDIIEEVLALEDEAAAEAAAEAPVAAPPMFPPTVLLLLDVAVADASAPNGIGDRQPQMAPYMPPRKNS